MKLKVGDKLKPHGKDADFVEEVMGVCGKVIFIKRLNKSGTQGPPEGPYDPEDLFTWGYTLIKG